MIYSNEVDVSTKVILMIIILGFGGKTQVIRLASLLLLEASLS